MTLAAKPRIKADSRASDTLSIVIGESRNRLGIYVRLYRPARIALSRNTTPEHFDDFSATPTHVTAMNNGELVLSSHSRRPRHDFEIRRILSRSAPLILHSPMNLQLRSPRTSRAHKLTVFPLREAFWLFEKPRHKNEILSIPRESNLCGRKFLARIGFKGGL